MDRKSACFIAAAQLAGAVTANLPDTVALDPEIKATDLRAENLMAWELFRVFYVAMAGAMDDETSWKSPQSGAAPEAHAGKLAELATALTPFASQLSPGILAVLNAAGVAIGAAAKPLPNPGEAKP